MARGREQVMAKKFFYVCAGLLCLAGAYALGARKAGAQGGCQIVAGDTYNTEEFAATADGRIYARGPNGPWTLGRSVPVTSPVVSLVVQFGQIPPNPFFYVYCQDGTVWECDGYSGISTSTNVCSGPVPANQRSWGAVKERYR
jgi:hypothetical protein